MTKTMSRNTFRAVARSIAPTIDRIGNLSEVQSIAVASMVLADADRIVAVLTADPDDRPDWADREADACGWTELSERIDTLRDAYNGRTLSDLRAETVALERAVRRLTTVNERATAVVARNAAAHAALDAIGTPAQAPAPARNGRQAGKGAAKA